MSWTIGIGIYCFVCYVFALAALIRCADALLSVSPAIAAFGIVFAPVTAPIGISVALMLKLMAKLNWP